MLHSLIVPKCPQPLPARHQMSNTSRDGLNFPQHWETSVERFNAGRRWPSSVIMMTTASMPVYYRPGTGKLLLSHFTDEKIKAQQLGHQPRLLSLYEGEFGFISGQARGHYPTTLFHAAFWLLGL